MLKIEVYQVTKYCTSCLRVNQLSEFKIKQEKRFQHNEQHLNRLILSSKRVSSGKFKKHVTYEGMYGFISKHHVKWIDFKESNVSLHKKTPYIWQNFITTEIDRKSTRLNSSHRLESRMPSSA